MCFDKWVPQVGSCSAWWVICGSLKFIWKIMWRCVWVCLGTVYLHGCLCVCSPPCGFVCIRESASECVCVCVCVCVCLFGRWNNEVDYESLSSVTRRNGSITRYVQERQSTAERGERLGHRMTFWFWREKMCGRQRKRRRREKNGDIEVKQEERKHSRATFIVFPVIIWLCLMFFSYCMFTSFCPRPLSSDHFPLGWIY